MLAGEHTDICWPLLIDVCATLRPGATAGSPGVPVILTAAGVGPQLAALVRSKLQAFSAGGDVGAAAEAWAALACLPHAAENAAQAAACCAALAAATAAAEDGSDGSEGSSAQLVLHCGALSAQAALLAASGEDGGSKVQRELLPRALALLARHPASYHAVAAAAEVLQQAANAGAELSGRQLQELLPLLAPNLSAASQPLRRETLRALCVFPMPAMLAPAGSGEPLLTHPRLHSTPSPAADVEWSAMGSDTFMPLSWLAGSAAEDAARGVPQQPSDALQQLLALESRQHGSDGGRPASECCLPALPASSAILSRIWWLTARDVAPRMASLFPMLSS